MIPSPLLLALACTGAMLVGGAAHAQSSWTMTSGCSQSSNGYQNTFGNQYACSGAVQGGGSAAGTSVGVTAWSTETGANTWESNGISSGGTSTQRNTYKTIFTKNAQNKFDWITYNKSTGAVYQQGSGASAVSSLPTTSTYAVTSRQQAAPSGAGQWFANAQVGDYGGNGFGDTSRVEFAQSPNHAIDSTSPGTTDLVLLTFDTAVILQQFGIGWPGANSGDSDLTLLRWTGTTAPQALSSATAPALGSSAALDGTMKTSSNTGGWEVVSSYDLAGAGTYNTGATQASSWWLVSTFNSTLFGSTTCRNSNLQTVTSCDAGDDAFKLNFLKTSNYVCANNGNLGAGGVCSSPTPPITGVPEPGSLGLIMLGAALLWSRRRTFAGFKLGLA